MTATFLILIRHMNKDTKTFKSPNFESLILKKLDIFKKSFNFQISNLSDTYIQWNFTHIQLYCIYVKIYNCIVYM